jgi:hypothetical protein
LADRQLPLAVYDFTFHHPTSKQLQQWEAMETVAAMRGNGNLLFMGLITICSSRIWILPACHIALPEGTRILSGVLTVQQPTKDIDNIPARACTNTPH